MVDQTFIRSLGILVIAAALFALGARVVRLPSIVAYLVAGLVLGPVTGLIEVREDLQLISEVGIVLLLFLVGLELSLEKVRDVGRVALLGGVWQVSLTAGGAWLLNRGLGFTPVAAAFLAAALTFSSTVVAVKLLEEKKEFGSLYGRIAIGVLLFQDLVVIVVLTFLAGFEGRAGLDWGHVALGLAKAFGGMGLLLAMVLAASRYGLPRPIGWAARSPETLFIWSLCWCFFVVWMAHLFHLSHETGAFLAGLGLAQLPSSHDLRRRVHPLMNFFIAVFFVSLGVKMKPELAAVYWKEALCLTAFVLVVKLFIVSGIIARMGHSVRTAAAAGVTLAQISEFSFILAAMGLNAGWIDEVTLSLVGVIGLASISISSCMITYSEPLLRWIRRLGLLQVLGASEEEIRAVPGNGHGVLEGHVIVVGMNTLGRELVRRLTAKGERVLAIDTDPAKLAGLPCRTLHGNAEHLSVLEEAGLLHAKMLISALHIEDTNDLLAYRCRSFGVPCGIHVIDLSVVDHLLEMDTTYLMIPKVDGIKLQTKVLKEMGVLKP